MKVAIVCMIVAFIGLLLEWQILSISSDQRKQYCEITFNKDGTVRKATRYEYYYCMSQ